MTLCITAKRCNGCAKVLFLFFLFFQCPMSHLLLEEKLYKCCNFNLNLPVLTACSKNVRAYISSLHFSVMHCAHEPIVCQSFAKETNFKKLWETKSVLHHCIFLFFSPIQSFAVYSLTKSDLFIIIVLPPQINNCYHAP